MDTNVVAMCHSIGVIIRICMEENTIFFNYSFFWLVFMATVLNCLHGYMTASMYNITVAKYG